MSSNRIAQASRFCALDRLTTFMPRVNDYAQKRNYDLGVGQHTAVSQLSPFIRLRLLLESEVAGALPEDSNDNGVQKFKQEVYWRTYWKGWLEQRPQVWFDYSNFDQSFIDSDSSAWPQVLSYSTGIGCFDHWTRELVETGYLHNHARMWYASIWIFTLRLNWQSGANFFMQHLLDGDAASNTLSWRWVAGLHTQGKHYLARADNIQRYTEERFYPKGQLNESADPIEETAQYPRQPLPEYVSQFDANKTYALLITDDDCLPEFSEISQASLSQIALLQPPAKWYSEKVMEFKKEALLDAYKRASEHFKVDVQVQWIDSLASLGEWFKNSGADAILKLNSPVGPTGDFLESMQDETDVPVLQITRKWDRDLWPHASAGYFKFKKGLGL